MVVMITISYLQNRNRRRDKWLCRMHPNVFILHFIIICKTDLFVLFLMVFFQEDKDQKNVQYWTSAKESCFINSQENVTSCLFKFHALLHTSYLPFTIFCIFIQAIPFIDMNTEYMQLKQIAHLVKKRKYLIAYI